MAPDGSIVLSIASYIHVQLFFVALTDGCLELQLRGKRDNIGRLNQLYEETSGKEVSIDEQTSSPILRRFNSCKYFRIQTSSEVTFESTESGLLDTNILVVRQLNKLIYYGPHITCSGCVLISGAS